MSYYGQLDARRTLTFHNHNEIDTSTRLLLTIMSSYAIVADPYEQQHVVIHTPSRGMLNFMAAGSAAALSSSLYNPLDCLRVRWQVLPVTSSETCLLSFGYEIVRREGFVNGLWRPGVGANAMGMGLSSGIRFGCYEPFRNALVGEDGEKSYEHMIAAGLVSGCMGYVITTPFHLLKTKIQAEMGSSKPFATDFMSGVERIVGDQGFASLYRGAIPLSSRGALFTAGQLMGKSLRCTTLVIAAKIACLLQSILTLMHISFHYVGYDGLKTIAKNSGYEDNVYLHIASGISASFCASFLSAPADLVMAKFMSSNSKESLADCVKKIYVKNGVIGFWRGWSLFFVRLTPSLLTYSTVYEQLRHNLGLGYFE